MSNSDKKGTFVKTAIYACLVAVVGSLILAFLGHFLSENVLFPFLRSGSTAKATSLLANKLIKTVYRSLFLLIGLAIGKVIHHSCDGKNKKYGYLAIAVTAFAFFIDSSIFYSKPIGFQAALENGFNNLIISITDSVVFVAVVYCGYTYSLSPPTSPDAPSNEHQFPTLRVLFFGLIGACVFAIPLGIQSFAVSKTITGFYLYSPFWSFLQRAVFITAAISAVLIGLTIRSVSGGREKKAGYIGAAFSLLACEISIIYLTLLRFFPDMFTIRRLFDGDYFYLVSLSKSYLFFSTAMTSNLWLMGAILISYRLALSLPVFERKACTIYLLLVSLCLGSAYLVADSRVDAMLISAAASGNRELVEKYLSEGADIETRDADRSTPLHLAIRSGANPVVEFLLNKGADIYSPDKRGGTPVDRAQYSKDPEFFELFMAQVDDEKKKSEYWMEYFETAVRLKELDIITYILEKEQDEDQRNQILRRGFSAAIKRKSDEMIKLLLSKGAKVDAIDDHGDTLLLQSVKYRNEDEASLLLKHGADPLAKDENGKTALAIARSQYNTPLVNMMLQYQKPLKSDD